MHPSTKLSFERFVASPSHSVMLVGSAGAGKGTVAKQLISQVLESDADITKNPYFLHISPDKNAISIEAIRQAHEFVRLKTTGDKTWRRAILVEDAHYLTTEAQNAFLKLLEEPPADTLIVLTSLSESSVLPTISSRTQQIRVKALSKEATLAYFDKDELDTTKAFYMSGGQIGLMTQLLNAEENAEVLRYVDAAKQFLQKSSFDKLVFIDQFTKQKDNVEQLLWALLAVSKAALYQAAQQDRQPLINRWRITIQAILKAQDSLPSHPLPKLLLTDLSLQL